MIHVRSSNHIGLCGAGVNRSVATNSTGRPNLGIFGFVTKAVGVDATTLHAEECSEWPAAAEHSVGWPPSMQGMGGTWIHLFRGVAG